MIPDWLCDAALTQVGLVPPTELEWAKIFQLWLKINNPAQDLVKVVQINSLNFWQTLSVGGAEKRANNIENKLRGQKPEKPYTKHICEKNHQDIISGSNGGRNSESSHTVIGRPLGWPFQQSLPIRGFTLFGTKHCHLGGIWHTSLNIVTDEAYANLDAKGRPPHNERIDVCWWGEQKPWGGSFLGRTQ